MKALNLMKENQSIAERSERFAKTIKRAIQRDIIDSLVAKKEELENNIYEATNFTLKTDINSGLKAMTVQDCEKRFKNIIEMEYELVLLDKEIEVKTSSFDKYFGDIVEQSN